MNILKKIYCRVFQKAFHLAIPVLPYRTPKILENISETAQVLGSKKIDKVLVVTDNVMCNSEMFLKLLRHLENGGIGYAVYSDTKPNPTVSNIEQARKVYIEKNCHGIIGYGGGSAIDCAKGVGARIARPKKSIAKMEGILSILKPIPFLVAIPTTAGTGSETTVTMVITDDETHHKFPISDFPLIPKCAVLDCEVTKTLPKSLTATTGMDALTHAVEAYIGNSTTRQTRKYALDAVKLISENLLHAYENGDDMTARKNMLYASFYAGAAFSKSYVGYCHAVAHSLGGEYNIPHGLANAVLLPITLESYGKSAYKKLKKLAIAFGCADESTDEKTASEAFIKKIRLFNEKMGIPKGFTQIKREDVPHLAKYADKEANPLYPVPLLMDAKELEQLYYKASEE